MNSADDENGIRIMEQPVKGEFPFPIMDGERESKFLTWVRNHSSYLTVGGFLGALQAGAAYIRGVIGNLIVLMPILLLVGVPLGLLHQVLIDSPLVASRYSMLVGLVLTLLYFGYDIGKNYVVGRPLEAEVSTGSLRRRWRLFCKHFIAIVILIVGVVFLIDVSPHIIEFVRKNYVLKAFGLKECAAAVLAAAATAGSLIRYFPKSKKIQVQILVVLVGLLSFAIIWGLTLRIANYVYYGLPPYDWQFWIPTHCLVILTLAALVAIWNAKGIGWVKQAGLCLAALFVAALIFIPCLWATTALKRSTDISSEGIGTLTRPLARVANGLAAEQNENKEDSTAGTETELLVEELVGRKLALDAEAPTEFESPKMIRTSAKLPNWFSDAIDWAKDIWGEAREPVDFRPKYFARTSLFLEQFETISDSNPREHRQLLRRLTRSALDSFSMQVGLDDVEKSPIDFQRVILQRVLASVDAGFVNNMRDITRMNSDQLKTWLDEMPDFAPIRGKLGSMRVPVSMASDYLKLSKGRFAEIEDYEGMSSPDFALNGPALFSDELLTVESLKKELALAKLRRALLYSNKTDIASELVKLDDAWFASRGSSREEFDWCADVSRASLFETVGNVLQGERDVNTLGISRYVQTEFVGDLPPEPSFDLKLKNAARRQLIEIALDPKDENHRVAAHVLGELYDPAIPFEAELGGANPDENAMLATMIYRREVGLGFSDAELLEIMAAQFVYGNKKQAAAEHLLRRMAHGKYGNLEGIERVGHRLFEFSVKGRLIVLLIVGLSTLVFCLLFVDPNSTSVHGFYRDRLASAFILTTNGGQVESERRVLLSQLSNYSGGGSKAPYHLINAAINLRDSELQDLRDRNADFFIFSKLFVGGIQTGFIRTTVVEAASPKLDASSAMAISAGAASPNMGKYTVSLATFLLTMLNVRLGYWIPNPDQLQSTTGSVDENEESNFTRSTDVVFSHELAEIRQRRVNANQGDRAELISVTETEQPLRLVTPSIAFDLFGLAFSGGGIRSAAVNMGNLQLLKQFGLFDSVDYLSTVSGGGYLGTSVSTFMRNSPESATEREAIEKQEMAGQTNFGKRLRWRPRFALLYKEMLSMLDAKSEHVNISDGGHVENLGAYELLRRRCKVFIVGEGESDPDGKFPGLSTLMRLAEIDMNIKISFRPGSLERMYGKPMPATENQANGAGEGSDRTTESTKSHFSVGKISYPRRDGQEKETGYMLYVRSSLVGDEDQIIQSYERSNLAFPHESTADQMFNEGQFEAYRRLGAKMMSDTLKTLSGNNDATSISYAELVSRLQRAVDN
jgi:hypothetical protein